MIGRGKHGIFRDEYLIRAHEFAVRGQELPNSKLTDDDVRAIRANRYGMTDKAQAKKYSVSPGLIYKIRKYERWRHVI